MFSQHCSFQKNDIVVYNKDESNQKQRKLNTAFSGRNLSQPPEAFDEAVFFRPPIQRQIQLQHIDARLAQEAELAAW